jgi:hypothetical protein
MISDAEVQSWDIHWLLDAETRVTLPDYPARSRPLTGKVLKRVCNPNFSDPIALRNKARGLMAYWNERQALVDLSYSNRPRAVLTIFLESTTRERHKPMGKPFASEAGKRQLFTRLILSLICFSSSRRYRKPGVCSLRLLDDIRLCQALTTAISWT